MIQDNELLNHIHQGADMNRNSIKHIIDLSDDPTFIHVLSDQLEECETIYRESDELLKEKQVEPQEASSMAKIMATLSSDMQTLTDRTTSKLSEIMIKGTTMGITNLTKQINGYQGTDKEVIGLAHKQLKTEQNNIEELKQFL